MKQQNPIVELLLAIITLGIYPMRKAAKAKREAAQTGASPGIVIPPPAAHIDTIANSVPSSPQPVVPVIPATPVVDMSASAEEPTATLPPTPPNPPTPAV
jgi:hypothetical protein